MSFQNRTIRVDGITFKGTGGSTSEPDIAFVKCPLCDRVIYKNFPDGYVRNEEIYKGKIITLHCDYCEIDVKGPITRVID